ncbi:MAG: isochorismatase family protein [Bacilli bacterium]
MKKRLLIVVDYQNDFVDGALGFEKAKELEPYLVNLIEEYKKNNDDIIYTMDTHQENYLQTEEGKYIPVVHCIRGTKGHELYGKIDH